MVLKLIATADVVSENFKTETMQEARPGLRHAVQTGPAPHLREPQGFLPGPYDHRTALDEVVQMMGGLAYMTRRPGDPLRYTGQRVTTSWAGVWRWGAGGADAARPDRPGPGSSQSALFENNIFLGGPARCCSSP